MSNNYQLAIIGSGSGGREATRLAARKGLRTALIEADRIGGTCFRQELEGEQLWRVLISIRARKGGFL
jgi:alkyl hydroperoxide reductase subunit AhpF